MVRADFPECMYTSPTSITGSEDFIQFINGTVNSVPGITVGKLRHWHCNAFRMCHGFRIACETGYSLTWGSRFLGKISLNNYIFVFSLSYFPSLVSPNLILFLPVTYRVKIWKYTKDCCSQDQISKWNYSSKANIYILIFYLGEPVPDRVLDEWCHELKGDTVLSSG